MNPYHSNSPKIKGGTLNKCPKCNMFYNTPSAISREDNKTRICPACGQKEAIEAFNKRSADA